MFAGARYLSMRGPRDNYFPRGPASAIGDGIVFAVDLRRLSPFLPF
jgi:hypothetical protein